MNSILSLLTSTAARMSAHGAVAVYCCALMVTPSHGLAAQTFAAVEHPAILAPRAAEGLLLDVARAGEQFVAVGAQGVIVRSNDAGATWTQAVVPVSSMLTAVAFHDAQQGWAVGHAGVVLRTANGGSTWQRVPIDTAAEEEASFLDVLTLGPTHVLLAGAYGVLCETRDAGATWTKLAPPVEDLHINRLTRGRDGAICAAGESGMLAMSRDDAATWTVFDSPYEGSFYGLHELASGRLLAHGLRGHVLISDDGGTSWSEVSVDEPVLLMSACEVAPGIVVLAGLGGHLFVSHDAGASYVGSKPAGLTGTAEIVATRGRNLIAVGENGARQISVP